MTAITTFQTRVVIDHIRGTSSGLAAANPTVGYGVFVVETDADRGKFGDGLTAYNDLPYFAGEATWSSLSGKPFSSIGSGLSVVSGVLSATGLAIADTTGLQTALDAKAPLASPTFTGTVSGVTKAMVGLSAVDNVADASKPVSTAQAAADAAVQAYAVQRANHTGTQVASTISDFSTASVAAVTWTTLTGKPSFATVATTGSYTDLSNTPSAYTLPTATASVLGGVKIGAGISIDGAGVISASSGYTLPIASASVLGGIKIGSGLSIDGSGVVSAAGTYTLPNATTTTLGGVIVGTGIDVASGTVSVSYGTSGTTACVGNDSRLSNARTPTAHNHDGSDITTGTVSNARLQARARVSANLFSWTSFR
jgi:hypothetical protein